MDRIKKIPPQIIVCVLISSVIFFLFFDFFTKGYVMDGAYDRRNNILPYYYIFSHSFRNLEIPQWNPFLFCGTTIFMHNVFFYPFNWIIWSFPESYLPALITVVLIVHFFFAGYFIWMLLKEIIKDRFWAICGSMSYLLSTSSMLSLSTNTEQFSIFVYLPALLYLVLTFSRRSVLSNFVLQTVANVLLILGGSEQVIVYGIGFYMLFVLFNGIRKEGMKLRIDSRLFLTSIASIIFVFMISAIKWIPYYSMSSNIFSKVSYDEFLAHNGAQPPALLTLFMPQFFVFMNRGEAYNCYSGVLAAFLGLYAMFFLWDKKMLFWKIMVLSITLIIMKTPLAYLHYIFTGENDISFGRMALLIPISFSILSGFAGKIITSNVKHLKSLIIFSGCLFLLVMFCSGVFYFNPGFPPGSENRTIEILGMKNAVLHFTIFFMLMAGLLCFLYLSKTRYKPEIFKILFFILILVDLLIIAKRDINSQNPFLTSEPLFKSLPHEREVAVHFEENNKNFRILGFSEGTSYNRSIVSNLYNSSGFESVPPFYIHVLYTYPYFVPRHQARHISPISQRVLELTSTRYILENDSIFEIPTSLPRYALYNDYLVIHNDNEAIENVLGMRGEKNIRRTVVLSSNPNIFVSNSEKLGGINVLKEGFSNILFETISTDNGILLLNDTYAEGWKAYVDGKETTVIRANYAFRAVAVPAGVHKVLFSFSAKGFKEGKIISIVSLLLFFSVILFYFWDKRRKNK